MSEKTLLKPMNLFVTPSDWAEIQDRIEACENPAESTVLAMMVWNYACRHANEKHNLSLQKIASKVREDILNGIVQLGDKGE